MSDKKNISDYMKVEIKSISPKASLKEAVALMLQQHTNGLVVTDEEKKVVGILSTWDIIQYIVPDYLEEDKHLASFESADLFAERILELQDHPIENFMTKQVHVCLHGRSLMEAATLLSEYKVRQLPVVDENNKLMGIVSRTQIKIAIGEILGLNIE